MPDDTAAARLFRPTRRERTLYLMARVVALLPDPVKIRLSGEPPIVVDGQQLDPQLQVIRSATHGRTMPGLIEPTIAAGRARFRRQTDVFRGPPTRVAQVSDIEMPTPAGTLRARHYAPPTSGSTEPRPITVYFHGGGFVIGDLDTHDEPCRMLCRHGGVHVLSIAYRLAPEHPFPAALDDAVSALAWARANAASLGADAEAVAVGGDSAGANLSAVLASGELGVAPIAQLLIYPATDFDSRRPSHDAFAAGFYLTRADMDAFRDAYLGNTSTSLADPRVSPLRASSVVGRPPALLVIAGFDPLRDDGAAYGEALARAGVDVRTMRYPALGHGFVHMTGVAPAAKRAMVAIAREWSALLGTARERQAPARAPAEPGAETARAGAARR
jgi:acetyl esterase/lipase